MEKNLKERAKKYQIFKNDGADPFFKESPIYSFNETNKLMSSFASEISKERCKNLWDFIARKATVKFSKGDFDKVFEIWYSKTYGDGKEH